MRKRALWVMRKLKSSLPPVVYVLWVGFLDLDGSFAPALLLCSWILVLGGSVSDV